MPELSFTVELPDGTRHRCYSPSSVVKSYFSTGQVLPASEFVEKANEALTEASSRVQQKFGFSCSGASASQMEIKQFCKDLTPEDTVTIISI